MKRSSQLLSISFALLMTTSLAALGSNAAHAQGPGSLDVSFGAGADDGTPAGIVSTSLGKGDDIANDIATTTDGKIVVAGNRFNGQSNDIVIVRYNADGSFDASFGKSEDATPDGVVNISLGDGDDFATSVAIQPDGKIVIGGYHEEGKSTNMVALRVNTDGTLDQGFGKANDGAENGIVNISLGDGDDIVRCIALAADGKIVLAGDTVSKDGSSNIVVARLKADGSPDASFGKDGADGTPDGFAAVSLGNGNDIANDIAIAADGKIVVSGSHGEEGNSNMAVVRFNADGTLDDDFGTAADGTPNGVVSLSLGDGSDIARGVALTPDGKIVLAGDSKSSDGSTNVIIARLNADGSLDEAFGVGEDGTPNGVTSTSLGKGNDYATDVVLENDGDAVVVGYHEDGSSTNIAVMRFKPDGALDTGFATSDDGSPNGIANISLSEGNDMASGVALQGEKLIVVGGTTVANDGSKNIAVVRLLAQ
ncbi:hypothetical protein [Aestuariivirga sp.]|uniref:hypothetical protein n=1 Tax=Aestuariivirga sp. TaxID=2650926 RepID=UPI003BA95DB2